MLVLVAPRLVATDRLAARMSVDVDTSNEWFIRYDNDMEVVSAYREEARRHGTHFLEAADLNPLTNLKTSI